MKTAICKSAYRSALPYPNATTRREVLHRLLDGILVAASGVGLSAILLLLIVL